jgi:HD-like signal output (HDOD) protein/GGDEF domain-containing protein
MIQNSLERVLTSDNLPSLPEVAVKVIQLAKQPEPDMKELINTIRSDGAIAGRILKFANSALFGVRRKPSSIEAAVPMLGTTMVRTLVLGFSLSKMEADSDSLRPWYQKLWRDSLVQASAAEFIAERNPSIDAPTWFLAGLLQDIGRLAMLSYYGNDYAVKVLSVMDDRSVVEREFDHVGFTHVDVSTGLCKRWNLDESIIEAIATHHHPIEKAVTADCHTETSLAAGLLTASRCCEYLDRVSRKLTSARHEVEKLLILEFGFRPDEIFRMLADVDDRLNELATGFSIDIGNPPSREALLERAQAALVDIAMRSHIARITAGRSSGTPEVVDTWSHTEPEGLDDQDTDISEHTWFDSTTGTYSEGFLLEALPEELRRGHSTDASTAFVVVSLDQADELLSAAPGVMGKVAEAVQQCVRPTDSVIRYGASSLIVLLPGLNIDILTRIAMYVCEEIQKLKVKGSPDGHVSAHVAGMVHLPSGRKPVDTKVVLKEIDKLVSAQSNPGNGGVSLAVLHGKKCRPLPVPAAPPKASREPVAIER